MECFNQTLKVMIRKVAQRHPNRWDLCLDTLLFTIRETPQALTGLAPFDLLYRRRPRGLLEIVCGGWTEPHPWWPCAPWPSIWRAYRRLWRQPRP